VFSIYIYIYTKHQLYIIRDKIDTRYNFIKCKTLWGKMEK